MIGVGIGEDGEGCSYAVYRFLDAGHPKAQMVQQLPASKNLHDIGRFALALDARDAQTCWVWPMGTKGVVPPISSITRQQAGRGLHPPRLAETLPI